MALEMELDYRLRWLDFDRYNRIQPVSVLDICQDVATLQAEEMGIGRDDMMKGGVFWVIVRMKYEILQEPKHSQVMHVRTWPHSPSGFSFLRDFTFCDDDGTMLIKATSEWVLMNAESRKFAKMRDHYAGPYDFVEDRAFDAKPKKIANFENGNLPVYTTTPTYSDIDLNGHVNNARYPSFVVNALKPQAEGSIRTLQIDYRHEMMPDAPISIHTLVEDGQILSKGVREDGNTAFACRIELK